MGKKEKDQAAAAAAAAAPKVAKKDNEVEFETATTAEAIAARREEEMAAHGSKESLPPAEAISEASKQLQAYIRSDIGLVKIIDNLTRLQSTYELPPRTRLIIFTDAVMSTNTSLKEFHASVQ